MLVDRILGMAERVFEGPELQYKFLSNICLLNNSLFPTILYPLHRQKIITFISQIDEYSYINAKINYDFTVYLVRHDEFCNEDLQGNAILIPITLTTNPDMRL